MAKVKTAVIKPKSIKGYGLRSPIMANPSTDDSRAMTNIGSGDYYGTGVRNPQGKVIRGAVVNPVSKKGLSKPPKKLA